MTAKIETIQCILDGARGIYIPQQFALSFCTVAWHVPNDARDILLSGPEHPDYWEAWDEVLRDAWTEQYGERWTLLADGDLFAVSDNHEFEY